MKTVSFDINSTAIQNVELLSDSQVEITWNNGKEYTYNVTDQDSFAEQLQNVILNEQSVGRFINQQIRADNLTPVTVWELAQGAFPGPTQALY